MTTPVDPVIEARQRPFEPTDTYLLIICQSEFTDIKDFTKVQKHAENFWEKQKAHAI